VHILEAVSTAKERHWESNLKALAEGKADQWFDPSSPALILIGQALTSAQSNCSSAKVDDGLQDRLILANSRRRA